MIFVLHYTDVVFHFTSRTLRSFENILKYDSRDSSVGIGNTLLFGGPRDPGRTREFAFLPASGPALGPTHPPTQKVLRPLSRVYYMLSMNMFPFLVIFCGLCMVC